MCVSEPACPSAPAGCTPARLAQPGCAPSDRGAGSPPSRREGDCCRRSDLSYPPVRMPMRGLCQRPVRRSGRDCAPPPAGPSLTGLRGAQATGCGAREDGSPWRKTQAGPCGPLHQGLRGALGGSHGARVGMAGRCWPEPVHPQRRSLPRAPWGTCGLPWDCSGGARQDRACPSIPAR